VGKRGPKPKPAALRLLEGRSEGRDSGGRKVPTPPRPVFVPATMPPGLPAAVCREWERVIAELVDRELPMPPPEVLAGYCRTLVRRREVAAALQDAEIGSTAWRRLVTSEGALAKRVARFCAEYFPGGSHVAPTMPAGLPTAVEREWARMVAELEVEGSPMPPSEVLAGYCRTLVWQHGIAEALEDVEIGSTQWRRLITTEDELSERIAEFHATYFPVAAPAGDYTVAEYQPFSGDPRPPGWTLPGTPPEYAAMEQRWGPPRFWRGHKLQTWGARDDARAVKAWAEFDPKYDPKYQKYAPSNGGPDD
jgi:phage terminase small subunit